MEYAKPELAVIGTASNAIRGGHKGSPPNVDGLDGMGNFTYTIGAYEADE